MHTKVSRFDRGLPQARKKTAGGKEALEKTGEERTALKAEFLPGGQAGVIYPEPRLARAYVIWQTYGTVFSPAEALEKGTLFPEIYSPYPY